MIDLVTVASATEVLELDLGKCNGYGNCVFAAPEMFELDLASNQPVLLQQSWSDADRAALADAVADCPAAALALRKRDESA
jgi:ferredoxin